MTGHTAHTGHTRALDTERESQVTHGDLDHGVRVLNNASDNQFIVETLQEIDFHTLKLINSTYPSTISDKSSVSYARALA